MEQILGPAIASSDFAPKRLIVMCGLPGSGKTTTAHRIREALNDALVISRDHIRNWYRQKNSFDEHSEREAMFADKQFFKYMEELLPFYNTVILDATFKQYEKRETALNFAKQKKYELILIECICRDETLLERLKHQVALGYKRFGRPVEHNLQYYKESLQPPPKQLEGLSFIQLDTETNRIVSKSLQDAPDQFAKQLATILEQPFNPSLFETFCANTYIENILTQKN